jgi:hypothetical protein
MTKHASSLGNASMFASATSLKILVMANQMTPSEKKQEEKKLIVHPSLICGSMNI